jgi:hypothetical protein
MILRKLQYDLVKDYVIWYIGLFLLKVVTLSSFAFGQWDVIGMNGNQLVKKLSEGQTQSVLLIFLGVLKLIEFINFIFVYRWLNNIKVDIMRFIRLLRKKR